MRQHSWSNRTIMLNAGHLKDIYFFFLKEAVTLKGCEDK